MRLQRFGPILEDKVGSDRSAGQLVAGDPETGDASSDQNRAALPETLPYTARSRTILAKAARYIL